MTDLPVPDNLADQIRAEAEASGESIPELLQQMLRERQRARQARHSDATPPVTKQLDAVYVQQPSRLDPQLQKLQARSLHREDW